jgi:superfamily II DNA/RNA helicase
LILYCSRSIEKLDVLMLNSKGERIIFCKTKAAVNKLAKIVSTVSGALHGSCLGYVIASWSNFMKDIIY